MKSFFQRIHESHSGTRKTTSDDPKPATYQLWPSRNDKGHHKASSNQNHGIDTGNHRTNDTQASNHPSRQPDVRREPFIEHPGHNYATIPSTSRKTTSISHSRPRAAAANAATSHPQSSVNQQLQGRYSEDHARGKHNTHGPPDNHVLSKNSSNLLLQTGTASPAEDRILFDRKYSSKPSNSRSRNTDTIQHNRVGDIDMSSDEVTRAQRRKNKEKVREEDGKGIHEHQMDKHRYGEGERGRERGQEMDRDRERDRGKERDRDVEQNTERPKGSDREREKHKEKGKEPNDKERGKRRQGRHLAMEDGRLGDSERERESDTERKEERMGKFATSPDMVKSRPSNREREKDAFAQKDGVYSTQSRSRDLYNKERDSGAIHQAQRMARQGDSPHEREYGRDQGQERRPRQESEGAKYKNYERERSAQEGSNKHRGHREQGERSGHRYKLDEPHSNGFSSRYAAPLHTAAPHQASGSSSNVDAPLPPRSTQASYQIGSKSTNALRKESTSILPQKLGLQIIDPMLSNSGEGPRQTSHHRRLRSDPPGAEIVSRTPSNDAVLKSATLEATDNRTKKGNNGSLPQNSSMQRLPVEKSYGKVSVPTVLDIQSNLPRDPDHVTTHHAAAHFNERFMPFPQSATKTPHAESSQQTSSQKTFKVEATYPHDSLQNAILSQSSPATAHYRLVSTQLAKTEEPNLVEIRHPQQHNTKWTSSDLPPITALHQRVVSPPPKHTQPPSLKNQQQPEMKTPTVQPSTIVSNLVMPQVLTENKTMLAKDRMSAVERQGSSHLTTLAGTESALPQDPVLPNPMSYQEPNSARLPPMYIPQSAEVSEHLLGGSVKTHYRALSTSEYVPLPASKRATHHVVGQDSAPGALMDSQSRLTHATSLNNQPSQSSTADSGLRSHSYSQDLKDAQVTIASSTAPVSASRLMLSLEQANMEGTILRSKTEPERAMPPVAVNPSSNRIMHSSQEELRFRSLGKPSIELKVEIGLQSSRAKSGPPSQTPVLGRDEAEGIGITATTLDSLNTRGLDAARERPYSLAKGVVLDTKEAQGYSPHVANSSNGSLSMNISGAVTAENLHGHSMASQTHHISGHFQGAPKGAASETVPHTQSRSFRTSQSIHVAQISERLKDNNVKARDDILQRSLPSTPIVHLENSLNPLVATNDAPIGSARPQIVPPLTTVDPTPSSNVGDALPTRPYHSFRAHSASKDITLSGLSYTQPLQSQRNPTQSLANNNDLLGSQRERTRPTVMTTPAEGSELRTVNQSADIFRAVDFSHRAAVPTKGSGIRALPDSQSQPHSDTLRMKDGTSSSGKHAHEAPPEEIKPLPIPGPNLRNFRPSTAMGFRQISGERVTPFSNTTISPPPGHAEQFSDDSNAKLATSIQRPSTALGSAYHRPEKVHPLGYSLLQPISGLPEAPRHRIEASHASLQASTSVIEHHAQTRDQGAAAPQSKRTRLADTRQIESNNRLTNKPALHPKIPHDEKGPTHQLLEASDRHAPLGTAISSVSRDHVESSFVALDPHQATSKNIVDILTPQSSTNNPVGEKQKSAKQSQTTNLWRQPPKDQPTVINSNSLSNSRMDLTHVHQSSTQRYGDLDKPSTLSDQITGTSTQELQKRKDHAEKIEYRAFHPPIQNAKLAELLSSPTPLKGPEIRNNITSSTPAYLANALTTSSNAPESTNKLNFQPTSYTGKTLTKLLHHDDSRSGAMNNPAKLTNSQELSALPTPHITYDNKNAVPRNSSVSNPFISSLSSSVRNESSPKQYSLPVGRESPPEMITSQPVPTRPHLNQSISARNEGASRANPHSNTSTRATHSGSLSDSISRQPISKSARGHQEQLPRKPSRESLLATPSSIAPSMLTPTASRTSILAASLSSQNEQRKRGLFSMFKSRNAQPSSSTKNEIPNLPKERGSREESQTNADDPNRKDKEREKTPSRVKLPPPIIIPVSTSQTTNRKSPNSKVFTPFRHLTSKRHRTVSAASIEAQDGTAPNTVVGSPTASIHSSQPPLQPPPLRDPFIATQEWRRQEAAEAREVPGGKLRRARPGVVFDVAEDPPERHKRQPQRSKILSRSS